MRAAGLW